MSEQADCGTVADHGSLNQFEYLMETTKIALISGLLS